MADFTCVEAHDGVAYCLDDYQFSENLENPQLYHCVHKNCKVAAIRIDNIVTVLNGKDNSGHTHPPIPFLVRRLKMIRQMIMQAGSTRLPLYDIFDTICASDMEVGLHLKFEHVHQMMQDERQKNLPILPHYLDQFAETMKEFHSDENLVTTLRSGDGTALLFSNEELLQSLQRAKRLVLETLYSVAPTLPRTSEVFVVSIQDNDNVIRVLHCLLNEAVSVDLYVQILSFVADRTGKSRILDVTSPFREDIVTAASLVFTESYVVGSPYHVAQSFVHKWVELRLTELSDWTLLNICLLSPYFPDTEFDDLQQFLTEVGDQQRRYHANIPLFIEFALSWMNHPLKVSFYNCNPTNSTFLESSVHSAPKNYGGKPPGAYVFAENVASLIQNEITEIKRVSENFPARKSWLTINIDKKYRDILSEMAHFCARRKTLKETIKIMSPHNHPLSRDLTLQQPRNFSVRYGGNVFGRMQEPLRLFGLTENFPVPQPKVGTRRGRSNSRSSNPYTRPTQTPNVIPRDAPPHQVANTLEEMVAAITNYVVPKVALPVTCIKCSMREATDAFFPCGHRVICKTCTNELQTQHEIVCKLCGKPATSISTIFT